MRTYARIFQGLIAEIILPAVYDAESPDWVEGDPSRIGDEIPIELRYHPDLVAAMIDITDMDPQPGYDWIFEDGVLKPPPPVYIDPRPGLLYELEQIDKESARPLRAIVVANPDIGAGTTERAELEALEVRASAIRAELNSLENPQ